jgi:heptosyltransferase-2
VKKPFTIVSSEPSDAPAASAVAKEPAAPGRGLKVFVKGVNWVGDAIMASPALRHLREQMPDANITVMVRPWVAPIYEHNPDITRLMVHDDSESLGKFFGAVKMVRRERFDIGIAFPNSMRSAFLLKLAGIPRRYGYVSNFMRGLLLNQGVEPSARILGGHQVYMYLGLLEELCGMARRAPSQIVAAGDLEREEVDRLLMDLGLDRGQTLIGLAPGSINSNAKRWPAERFAQAADRIAGDLGAAVLLLGSIREQDVLDRVTNQCRVTVHNLAGKVNLGQAIALTQRLAGLISNDSGAMHIAAALRIPTVAIFGPTEWNATYPFSPMARVVRKEGVPCAPCMLRECPINGHPCMTGVTVEMVLNTFYALIEEAGQTGESPQQPWARDPRRP